MKIFLLFVYVLILAGLLAAEPYTMDQANEYYQKNDWQNAVKAYSEIVKTDPGNGLAWFRLGRAFHGTGKFQESLDAYQKAETNGAPVMPVLIGRAKALAKLNRSPESLDALKKAADQGFNQSSTLKDDPDLASIRTDNRYAELVKQVERNEKPCTFDPEFRQFDFWIGEWNVTQNGSPAGTSKVELILKDCVLVENWTSAASNYNGKSYNVYNPGVKKWQQFWVDDAAGPSLYIGEFIDKEMRFESVSTQRDGSKLLLKMTFSNLGPDKVRQYIQQSTDDGKSWSVMFDGEYNRKK